ncbi:hypothetical protein [Aureliella helgolandensis]|uniref:DUF4159 domain-containing protein n=1 Tax=Aureliella helgolandensis TaxID=2527968 RepID=A0A518GFY0_9BACT|nr:hypothetical protein [Aureliella helgolandensis]QDV27499.1 hypothetical protein Q31a_58880 [Aureliella helgolandensis]
MKQPPCVPSRKTASTTRLHTPPRRHPLAAAAAILVSLCLVQQLPAQAVTTTLTDTFKTRPADNGQVLQIDCHLVIPASMTAGTLHCTASTVGGPSRSDRDLTLVLTIRTQGGTFTETAYRQHVLLPEDSIQVTAHLPFTASQGSFTWDVKIFENQRNIENASRSNPAGRSIKLVTGEPSGLAVARIVDSSVNSQSTTSTSDPIWFYAQLENNSPELSALNLPNAIPRGAPPPITTWDRTISIADAAEDWREYLPYYLWSVSGENLQEIVGQRPRAAQAIAQYVACGGNLLVHSVDQVEEHRSIEQLLGVPLAAPTSTNWWPITQAAPNQAQVPRELDPQDLAQQLQQPGFQRQHHLGGIVLVATHSVPGLSPHVMRFLLVDRSPLSPSQGTDTEYDGSWFWLNLITTVGKPPVWTFCATVVLFGALLGPGLLVLTARLHRRSLMLFFVPVISALATGAIVLYGIVHEGFSTHARITSVQYIEPTTGEGFAWSRQNYFSGLPPRDGLNFPRQTYARPVYPIHQQTQQSNFNSRPSVTATVVEEGDQQFWQGWLRPRQQQQLLVGQPIQQAAFPIAAHANTKPAPGITIENLTAYDVPIVILRGAADDYYVTESLRAGEQISLTATNRIDASSLVAKLFVPFAQQVPVEIQGSGSLMNFGQRRNNSGSFSGPPPRDILQMAFQQFMSDKLELPHFGIATLLTQSSAVKLPLEGQSADNLHLVVGVQPW